LLAAGHVILGFSRDGEHLLAYKISQATKGTRIGFRVVEQVWRLLAGSSSLVQVPCGGEGRAAVGRFIELEIANDLAVELFEITDALVLHSWWPAFEGSTTDFEHMVRIVGNPMTGLGGMQWLAETQFSSASRRRAVLCCDPDVVVMCSSSVLSARRVVHDRCCRCCCEVHFEEMIPIIAKNAVKGRPCIIRDFDVDVVVRGVDCIVLVVNVLVALASDSGLVTICLAIRLDSLAVSRPVWSLRTVSHEALLATLSAPCHSVVQSVMAAPTSEHCTPFRFSNATLRRSSRSTRILTHPTIPIGLLGFASHPDQDD
jgi:hypothetical protein